MEAPRAATSSAAPIHGFQRSGFETNAANIIGLYLAPPANAAVFCVDEKSVIQALDLLDPVLPLSPGRVERHGFEYFPHGTLSLHAALETQGGRAKQLLSESIGYIFELLLNSARLTNVVGTN